MPLHDDIVPRVVVEGSPDAASLAPFVRGSARAEADLYVRQGLPLTSVEFLGWESKPFTSGEVSTTGLKTSFTFRFHFGAPISGYVDWTHVTHDYGLSPVQKERHGVAAQMESVGVPDRPETERALNDAAAAYVATKTVSTKRGRLSGDGGKADL